MNEDDSEYSAVMDWGLERLMKVSVPCELSIASHFRKKLRYPYLDDDVVRCIGEIDLEELRPHSMEDRKTVLKTVASELGFPMLAHRTKKASQYGSSTTDLIRGAARAKGVRYNRFISDIYESLGLRNANLLRDSAVDVRMDPILLHDAEEILAKEGITHSEAVARFYRRMVEEGNTDFLDRDRRDPDTNRMRCRRITQSPILFSDISLSESIIAAAVTESFLPLSHTIDVPTGTSGSRGLKHSPVLSVLSISHPNVTAIPTPPRTIPEALLIRLYDAAVPFAILSPNSSDRPRCLSLPLRFMILRPSRSLLPILLFSERGSSSLIMIP